LPGRFAKLKALKQSAEGKQNEGNDDQPEPDDRGQDGQRDQIGEDAENSQDNGDPPGDNFRLREFHELAPKEKRQNKGSLLPRGCALLLALPDQLSS